ncbi:hypothetical protein EFM09_08340 [Latilactobacillus curvatus]|nr:hypothetical protein [Latilactobacillus curvatus]UNC18565.1 transposase [Latilactobacillus sakei]
MQVQRATTKGYDAGKKISGIKRHLAVDINGFPQAIHMTRANVSDRDGGQCNDRFTCHAFTPGSKCLS